MRPSNRDQILAAAAAVVQRDGVTALTLESVAAGAGLTKGGLMYHFRTREALLQAVHEHLSAQWEGDLAAVAGPGGSLDSAGRLAAYVRVATQSATRAELVFMLDAATHPEQVAPWNDVIGRWAPPEPAADATPAELTAFVARLAADGLWLYDALTDTPLPAALRQRLSDHIAGMAQPD